MAGLGVRRTQALRLGWLHWSSLQKVPKPRVNLTRFHGVFAPNSKHRARVTPAKRGRGSRHATTADPEEPTPGERRAAMTWAQRLKRVFGIDIETCPDCGTRQPYCKNYRRWSYRQTLTTTTSIAGMADYLVTGDKRDLLSLGKVGMVQVITARAFADLLGLSTAD